MEMGNKALIITGKNVQDHEFIYPYYRFKEAGYDIVMALKDKKETTGILGTKIPCDTECEIISYEELETYGYDCDVMIIPGGAKAMEYLRQEGGVLAFIKDWNSLERPIFTICHGAQLLISAKILKGRTVAAYYSIEDDIENAGAEYCRTFCKDNNIYSASHYKYLGEWTKWIKELK